MTGQMKTAIDRMAKTAAAELKARKAFNTARSAYLKALRAAGGDDSQVPAAIKAAVNTTGFKHSAAEIEKRQARADYDALQR